MDELTLDEKISLTHGADFMRTHPIERLGIPRLKVTDGPAGARGMGFAGPRSAWFPCGSSLGSTWDVDLVHQIGEALGEQVRSKGASVLLGPTVNIHRAPLAGRNFECYSEDPHLTSRLAVAYITGLQSRGVGACIKHYVCNDQEHERHTISSEVDERTLREIYLPAFEAAVKEADVWWVMAAYNAINGTFASEHRELIEDVLRGEWGFTGGVISDWWGTKSIASANAGQDLEMPGPGAVFPHQLKAAVDSGDVDESVVDAKVRRVLSTIERAGEMDTETDNSLDRPEDRALIRRAGADGMVLLRNESDVLPLRDVKRLAVIGPNAWESFVGGGGSSEVNPHYTVSPMQGITAATDAEVVYELGCTAHDILPALPARLVDMHADYFDDVEFEGAPVRSETTDRFRYRWMMESPIDNPRFSARFSGTFTPDRSGTWTFGLVSAGVSRLSVDGTELVDNWTRQERGTTFFGIGSAEKRGTIELTEGQSVELVVEFASRSSISALYIGCLPPVPDDAIERAARAAGACDAAVVVAGLNPDLETEGHDRASMDLAGRQEELIAAVASAQPNTVVVLNVGSPVHMPWADEVAAILQAWYPGQEWGNALADVLFGAVNPSGKLPTTFPKRIEDNPSHGNYPGSDGMVRYEEGVFVGYRHYDTRNVEPLFCFGHGLSYTSFSYGELRVDQRDDEVVCEIDVTNTGERAGAEVVQLYVRDEASSVPRPEKELAAFAKLRLEPGQTETATFTLGPRAFSYWGPDGWTLEGGAFELLCGASSRDIRAVAWISR